MRLIYAVILLRDAMHKDSSEAALMRTTNPPEDGRDKEIHILWMTNVLIGAKVFFNYLKLHFINSFWYLSD